MVVINNFNSNYTADNSCIRLVKITSPNLNYIIILGAVLMYSSIYFSVLLSVNPEVVQARCIVSVHEAGQDQIMAISKHIIVIT